MYFSIDVDGNTYNLAEIDSENELDIYEYNIDKITKVINNFSGFNDYTKNWIVTNLPKEPKSKYLTS